MPTSWISTSRISKSSICVALVQFYKWFAVLVFFYIYCLVEVWDEWNAELVVMWRPAVTGVAAAADAVRRNWDGDGVLVVGWSHVIRRCLDFMRWMARQGGGGGVPRTFLFFCRYLIEWSFTGKTKCCLQCYHHWRKGTPPPSFPTHKLYCAILHFGLWLQSDFLCGIELRVRQQSVWSRLCWWPSRYLGHGGKWVQGTVINANIQRMFICIDGGGHLLATNDTSQASKFVHGTLIS